MWRCPLLFVPSVLVVFGAGPISAGETEREMTRRVDGLLAKSWKNAGVEPAPPATDATFLRRAFLDLTGAIPTVGEVRTFLRDQSPDKRARLIDRLLGTAAKNGQPGRPGNSRHATHLANIWQEVMLPQVNTNIRFRYQSGAFNQWLRNHFADNTPYDKVVTELLTYTGSSRTGPGLFYQVLEYKPEELAASTSRIFLGVQIQCAQCHDHPFDHWTQKDFWGYAGWFAQIQQPQGRQRFQANVADTSTGDVKLPETDNVIKPRFLGVKKTSLQSGPTRRAQVAAWLTSKNNPFFAKATVNRVWALLFGYGLVDPVDDFGKHNPPTHPELLDALAADFAANNFDLRRLFRILAKSRGYQLSSRVTESDSYHPNLFHRMAIKSLNAGQIYDCLETATCKRDNPSTTRYRSPYQYDRQRQAFVGKFEAPTQSATEFQAGIPQALTMMNGQFIASATNVAQSDILVAVAESPFMTDEQRVETLFLAALSRKPTAAERKRFVEYVKRRNTTQDSRNALGDVLWALLNSTEFILNH